MTRETRTLLALWGGLALITAFTAIPRIDTPGLYYDEAFMAQQARDFAEPERMGLHAPSTRSTRIFGRSYPLRNAAYLGSLKSQLTIPSLVIFGSSPRVLRITTLAWSLLGLLLSMLWIQRSFGATAAGVTGILMASDPSFYFFSQFEWGPFTTGLLCRSGGFLLLIEGWKRNAAAPLFAAGLVLGLGVYSRVDFVVILAAAGLALALCRPDIAREALGERRRQSLTILAGFALTATTMLVSARQIFTASSGIGDRGDLAYKAQVLWSVLDGSHFLRLMRVGGLFDEMFEARAVAGVFGVAVAAGATWALARIVRGALRSARPSVEWFPLLSTLLLTAAMLAMPGAVRAHHMLNLMPFAHLLVACELTRLWGGATPARRATAGLLLLALVGCNLHVASQTAAEIAATGGRGRWSDALQRFTTEIDNDPQVVVSLDWGFHEPLQFAAQRARFVEPIWHIPVLLQQGRPWIHEGDENHIYLIHEDTYDLFGLSKTFLEAVHALAPGSATIETHRDRAGNPAFLAIRLERPHRLIYTGEFRIDF